MNNKLFVANLNWSVGENALNGLFSQVGEVVSVHIPKDRDSGRPRGFAFVEMATPEQAQHAIQTLNNSLLMEREMVVTLQDPNRQSAQRPQRRPFHGLRENTRGHHQYNQSHGNSW